MFTVTREKKNYVYETVFPLVSLNENDKQGDPFSFKFYSYWHIP